MTFLLRPLARSRGLRALSMLAWLMLVVSALTAPAVSAQQAQGHHPALPTALLGSPAHHHALGHAHAQECCHDHAGCCGGPSACGCIGTGASMLPPTPASVASATPLTAPPERPRPLHAPSAATSPPLRPPMV